MRTTQLLSSLLLALSSASATPELNTYPFERATLASRDAQPHLDKRQANNGGCAPNQQSCSSLNKPGAGSACCPQNALCTLDNAGNVACCPQGAFCTGTLTNLPTTQPVTTSTTTGGVVVPGTGTTTPTVTGPAPTYTPGQYINNAYYPFPVLWLSGAQFPDASQCAAAYQTCDQYYTSCTNALQSEQAVPPGYGVTVSAPGGGFTAAAGGGGVTVAKVDQASATSICGSLRNVGCPGQGATCGGGGAAPTPTPTEFVVVPPANRAGRGISGGSAAALVAILTWAVVAW